MSVQEAGTHRHTGTSTETDLDLVVTGREDATEGVVVLTLADPAGTELPPWSAGAHVDLVLAPDLVRQYSLCGDPADRSAYRVGVLREPAGRGGSAAVHDRLHEGTAVHVRGPRNGFPLQPAARYLFLAGGIGITPLLSHARAAVRWDRSFTLLYGYRPGAAAHLAELRELCGSRLHELPELPDFLSAVESALSSSPIGTHLYACGPAPMLDGVLGRAAELGWPEERLHTERFSAAALDPGEPFEAVLRRSGRRVPVPSGVSLLGALEQAGVPVRSMCRQGVCGECRVGVLSGAPLHRDLFLSDEEKAADDSVMCCVSRSSDPYLELDL